MWYVFLGEKEQVYRKRWPAQGHELLGAGALNSTVPMFPREKHTPFIMQPNCQATPALKG